MKYAVLQTGGKQYKVAEGDVLEVEKIEVAADSPVKFENILFYSADGVLKVGQPHVDGVTVTAKVLEQIKGTKIRVSKFKAKARHRRVTGHRQLLTKLQITKIALGGEKTVKEKAETKAKKTDK